MQLQIIHLTYLFANTIQNHLSYIYHSKSASFSTFSCTGDIKISCWKQAWHVLYQALLSCRYQKQK